MLEFFYRLQVFHGFYRGVGRNNGTLEEWDKGVDDLMTMASPLTLLEKSVVKRWASQPAIQKRYGK